MTTRVLVQADDFDVAAEVAAITAGRRDIGAVVTFTGLCRDEGGRLAALELEHYPGMAEEEIARGAPALAARRGHGHSSLRQDRARRPDRARGRRVIASGGGVRGRRVPDGLSQDAGALLEKRASARRPGHRMGGGEGRRRQRAGALALAGLPDDPNRDRCYVGRQLFRDPRDVASGRRPAPRGCFGTMDRGPK